MDKLSKTRESEADKNSHRAHKQVKSNTAVKKQGKYLNIKGQTKCGFSIIPIEGNLDSD